MGNNSQMFTRLERIPLKQGFVQVCEIANPPKGKCAYIIFRSNGKESFFIRLKKEKFEELWRQLKTGRDVFKKSAENNTLRFGHKTQRVKCGDKTPWFYSTEECPNDFTDKVF